MTIAEKYYIIIYTKMYNKRNCFIILISALLIGCSNQAESKLTYTNTETVKDVVKERELDIRWTKEIEGSRLNENISSSNLMAANVDFLPSTIKIIKNYNEPVYPSIESFGNLDVSNLSEQLETDISDFCKALADNIYAGPEKYFKENYIFNLVFFKKDLMEKWPVFFEEDFPVKPDDFKKEQDDSNKEQETVDPDPIFTKWYLGQPFIGETITEVPVRFFSKNGKIDVTIFISTQGGNNSIYQVTINRWEKSDGRE